MKSTPFFRCSLLIHWGFFVCPKWTFWHNGIKVWHSLSFSISVFFCCYDILQFSTLSGCCLPPPHYRQTFRYCNFVFAKRGDNNSSSWHLVAKCLESFQVKMPYVASVKQRWHEIYEESRVVLAKLCSEDIIHFCRFLFVCCL